MLSHHGRSRPGLASSWVHSAAAAGVLVGAGIAAAVHGRDAEYQEPGPEAGTWAFRSEDDQTALGPVSTTLRGSDLAQGASSGHGLLEAICPPGQMISDQPHASQGHTAGAGQDRGQYRQLLPP